MRLLAARPKSFDPEPMNARVATACSFQDADDGGIAGLDEPGGHRAIGVVHDPGHERWGNHVPTVVPGAVRHL